MTLPTLIGYLSSLSTTVMVLVYIITTSRQLETMSKQLSEMEYTRNLQVQPLPYFKTLKAKIILPKFYSGPETDFKKMEMYAHLTANFDVSNLGNGPAITVDFSSILLFGPRGKVNNIILNESYSPPINYVPVESGEDQEAIFIFSDEGGQKLVEALVNFGRLCLETDVVYKNTLGTPFHERIACWLNVKSQEDFEIIKSRLKLAKTAKIEFSDQLKTYETMKTAGRQDDAHKILEDVNKKILEHSKCVEEIDFSVSIAYGGFSVKHISEPEYYEILRIKANREQKKDQKIKRCWEKHEPD